MPAPTLDIDSEILQRTPYFYALKLHTKWLETLHNVLIAIVRK